LAHVNLGNALQHQGKLEEAVAEFRTAIRLRPDLVGANHNLGVALDERGKTQEALVAFREAIRLDPDNGAVHNSLALVLAHFPDRSRRDYDEALVHAKRAVALGPEKGNRYNTLALAEYRLGHWTESIAASERSMALENGGDAFNWFLMALADWQKGEKDKARSWFDKAVAWMREQNPNPVLRQPWTEGAELLGQPGPDAAGAGSRAAPAAEKPR
jgi:superkiller protein 3